MSEFVGRTGANRVYSYPEGPKGAAIPPPQFARNFASGPATETLIAPDPTGTLLPWSSVDVGAPGTNVPITPQSSGIIRIAGVIVIKNSSTDPAINSFLEVIVQVNGVGTAVPFFENVSVFVDQTIAIPVLTETDTPLPVGVPANISILLVAGDTGAVSLIQESSSLDVQEVSPATG